MKSNFGSNLSQYWNKIQRELFPFIEEELDAPLSKKHLQLISTLELIRIESFVFDHRGSVGRPPKSRHAVARSFVAKSIFRITTTKMLHNYLHSDKKLRLICGFESRNDIPHESAFCRAFEDFAESELAIKAHEILIKNVYENELVGHVIKDSTAITAREKRTKKIKKEKKAKTKRRKAPIKELKRIEKQAAGLMTLSEMIKDLPVCCDVGQKTSPKGYKQIWVGYKFHLSVDDHGIPLVGLLTSASMCDSQAAIPLALMTNQRVQNLYDLMDAGYHANAVIEHSKSLGHVPLVDRGSKSQYEKEQKRLEKLARKTLNWLPAEAVRYKYRTVVERTFSRLKDEFGACNIRVKGGKKIYSHLMFCILALAADQLLRLVI
jgi:hypothetical protein